jgi:hypothetical protein
MQGAMTVMSTADGRALRNTTPITEVGRHASSSIPGDIRHVKMGAINNGDICRNILGVLS